MFVLLFSLMTFTLNLYTCYIYSTYFYTLNIFIHNTTCCTHNDFTYDSYLMLFVLFTSTC